ncbi:cupin domain-containing protein [Candidatus Bipolaricaulota bacterium]
MHRALKKKKLETGVNVKDLGNCALRAVLERPLLAEAIGRRIISLGLVSEEEFEDLRRNALQDITAPASDVASLIHPTKRNTMATGSWEIKEIFRDASRELQILLVWAKDRQLRPMSLHRHTGFEFLVVLSGAIMISVDIETSVVKAPDCQFVPQGAFHSVTPLDRETLLLAILSPPEEGIPPSED